MFMKSLSVLSFAAYQPGAHRGQQEVVCLLLGRLRSGGKTVQGTVHAGRSHAATHWGEAPQMHRQSF
jgi:predicted NBD/HSP70 family sugar kinase